MSVCTCISIYIYIMFLKNDMMNTGYTENRMPICAAKLLSDN
jgi:hypothetical protein